MKETLQPGLKVDFTYTVPPERTVPYLLPEAESFGLMPEVLATGYMVGLFEWACVEALKPHLDWPAEQTVGVQVDFSHVAATPPGLKVHITGTLEKVEGKKLTFALQGHDGVDLISSGTHERFVIDKEKFDARLAPKTPG